MRRHPRRIWQAAGEAEPTDNLESGEQSNKTSREFRAGRVAKIIVGSTKYPGGDVAKQNLLGTVEAGKLADVIIVSIAHLIVNYKY